MEPRKEPSAVESLFKYGIDYQLHLRKGKQYITQKAPADIAFMYADGRYRLSTGTPDKALAKAKAQHFLRKIEEHFDRSRRKLDPFVEGLRPYLESQGVNVISWYKNDYIEHELAGESTHLWALTGGKYSFSEKYLEAGMWTNTIPAFRGVAYEELYSTMQRGSLELDNSGADDVFDSLRFKVPNGASWDTYVERFIANDYATLAELVTRLGGFVPTHLVNELDAADAEMIGELKKPLNPDVVLLYSNQLPETELLESIRLNANHLPRTPQVNVADAPPDQIRFSDVVEDYLNSKTEASKEQSQRLKACKTVIRICGDRPLAEYTKLDAYDIAMSMHKDGYSRAQISKMITYGRGLFKYATKTRGTNGEALLVDQPWKDIELDDYGKEKRKYKPLELEELHALFALAMGNQERLLLSILLSTGMRLDEVALITWERIREYKDVLCFCLTNDTGDERFKNRGSMRYVPVPDVIKPMLSKKGQGRLFTYRVDRDGKAQAAASDAVMPLIRQITKDDRKVAHSLRGNFKDALRELEVSKELNDFITGHAQGDVGGRYGEGPSIAKRAEVMNRIQHPYFEQSYCSTQPY
jgi:integrase